MVAEVSDMDWHHCANGDDRHRGVKAEEVPADKVMFQDNKNKRT